MRKYLERIQCPIPLCSNTELIEMLILLETIDFTSEVKTGWPDDLPEFKNSDKKIERKRSNIDPK